MSCYVDEYQYHTMRPGYDETHIPTEKVKPEEAMDSPSTHQGIVIAKQNSEKEETPDSRANSGTIVRPVKYKQCPGRRAVDMMFESPSFHRALEYYQGLRREA